MTKTVSPRGTLHRSARPGRPGGPQDRPERTGQILARGGAAPAAG